VPVQELLLHGPHPGRLQSRPGVDLLSLNFGSKVRYKFFSDKFMSIKFLFGKLLSTKNVRTNFHPRIMESKRFILGKVTDKYV
jgi:hypothetical protein